MNEKKKDTVSMQLWLPTLVYEKAMEHEGDKEKVNQCERFRSLLLVALSRHLESPEIPLRIISENERRPVTIPFTIERTDYDRLTELAKNTGLSKKKLAEVLICEEVL